MNLFSKKTAKHILALGFLLVIGLFVSVAIISLQEVHTVGNLTKMIYEHPFHRFGFGGSFTGGRHCFFYGQACFKNRKCAGA